MKKKFKKVVLSQKSEIFDLMTRPSREMKKNFYLWLHFEYFSYEGQFPYLCSTLSFPFVFSHFGKDKSAFKVTVSNTT